MSFFVHYVESECIDANTNRQVGLATYFTCELKEFEFKHRGIKAGSKTLLDLGVLKFSWPGFL